MRSAGRLLPPQQRPYGSSRIAQMTWHPEASSGPGRPIRGFGVRI